MRTLKGSVDLLGLGNLLQILSMNGREGVLTIADLARISRFTGEAAAGSR